MTKNVFRCQGPLDNFRVGNWCIEEVEYENLAPMPRQAVPCTIGPLLVASGSLRNILTTDVSGLGSTSLELNINRENILSGKD